MRLFFDLDRQELVIGPSTAPLTSINQKRSPNASIEIQFLRQVTPQELAAGATGIFEVKEAGKYDANSIFRAGSWVKTGTGVNTIYTFTLDLMTESGDLLLGVNDPITVTATNGTDLFNATAHGLANGAEVQFSTSGTLPAGILANQDYFVVSSAANTFQVSLTSGGSAVNFTTDGSGTHQVRRIDNDASSVTLMAAMQYVAGGQTIESQNVDFIYRNDIVRDGDTSPVADPEDIIINIRAGKQAIGNAVEFVAVTFSPAFAGGSNVDVVATMAIPASGDNIFAVIDESTVTVSGFTARFSAPTPNANYKLNYMAVAV